jgi:hypothetical protein
MELVTVLVINRVATFSFDPTRRYWIYRRRQGYILIFFTNTYIEKLHILQMKSNLLQTSFISKYTSCSSKHFSIVRPALVYLENQENPHMSCQN